MFGGCSGKKLRANKKQKRRKYRGNNQSVECIGRSYRNNPVGIQQNQSTQFLPEVGKSVKSTKSGSVARSNVLRKDEDCYNTNQTYETLSDEKIS
jgi:hypothetical protein